MDDKFRHHILYAACTNDLIKLGSICDWTGLAEKKANCLGVLLIENDMNLDVCRKVFHIHCLMHERSLSIVENDKSFSFNKGTHTCALDFEKYWKAVLMKNGQMRNSVELRTIYDSRMAHSCEDLRVEVQGYDFVHYLYLCVKKMKPKMSMDNEEFANMFWKYIDLNALKHEHLFAKIAEM